MILLIPYRNDVNNGHELRYAIRSMVKYFTGFTGVVIIGDKPHWYKGEHIPANDKPGRKEWSIVSKVLMAPCEQFLLSNDDVFALAPFGTDLPNYYSGPLTTAVVHGKYIARRDAVRTLYPDGMFYDVHTPMVIHLPSYHYANSKADWVSRDYLCKSVYGNYVGVGELLADCKVRHGKDIPAGPFFSTNDRTAQMIDFNKLYPDASQYEK